jgi:hypothetical protein
MIDNAGILVTTLMVLYVIVRAAVLSRRLPWFETRSLAEKKGAAAPAGRAPTAPPVRSPVPMPANRPLPAARR